MVNQTITQLPTPPSTTDVVNFNDRADNFLAAIPTFVTQTNTVIGQINSTETNINSKESSATNAASTATTQAGIATTKASEASASATAAYNAQLAAEAVFDSFDDKYLGAKATAPTVDNDGNPLVTGALYFRTTAPKGIYVYDAELSAWSIFSYIPTSHGTLSGRSDADSHPMSAITGLVTALSDKLSITGIAADSDKIDGFHVNEAGVPYYRGFMNNGTLIALSAINLNSINYNHRCTVSGVGTNAPDSTFWYVDTYAYAVNSYILQIATSLDTLTPNSYIRTCRAGTWGSWRKITFTDEVMGVGQSWQDVTFSRDLNVTYTNTTGKPITIWVQTTASNSVSLQFVVGGIHIPAIILTSPSGIYATGSVVVPPGSTYKVLASGYNAWFELR